MRLTRVSCLAFLVACQAGSVAGPETLDNQGAGLPVIASFAAAPASITAGATSVLSWSVSGATSLSVNPGLGAVGGVAISVSPATTTTYTLSATNDKGTVSATATITVAPSSALVDPHIDDVVLLMHMTGADGAQVFRDATGRHIDALKFGNPAISTAESAFGGGSAYFDGSSFLRLPADIDWDLTGGDATVEAWIYPIHDTSCTFPAAGVCERGIVGQSPGISDSHWFVATIDQDPYGLGIALSGTADDSVWTGVSPLSTMWGRWNHFAISKVGASTSVYLNGVRVASAIANPFDGAAQALEIGGTATVALGDALLFRGYMNELRITKGVGRYTADFSVPTEPFPDPSVRGLPSALPTNAWTGFTQTDTPAVRGYHSMVWTGSKAIVFGGNIASGVGNDGYTYDPLTHTWDAISTAGAPSMRMAHTAVWTGKRMIVWGGSGPTSVAETDGPSYADGAIYDPATDTWFPMSSIGAPSARHMHSAIWTGLGMIVWGGTDDVHRATAMNDGGIYHPASDTWSPLVQNAPTAARQGHAAVWTGSQMMVWGGIRTNVVANDGALYDPSTGQWSALVDGNTPPTPKYAVQGAWSNSELLVWGGVENDQAAQHGWAYNPATQMWRALPATGEPSARYAYGAAWDGNQWLIWGGIQPGVATFNNGGAYFY